MRRATVFAFLAIGFGASACNSTLDQRTINRTATGAIIGTAGTVIVGGNPIRGALVGGVVGALTSKNQHVWD